MSEAAEMRAKIKQGFNEWKHEAPCVGELAELAADTSFCGFEDPRAAAAEQLDKIARQLGSSTGKVIVAPCPRYDCLAEVTFNKLTDEFATEGVCSLAEFCVKELWDRRKEPDADHKQLLAKGLNRGSSEVFATVCPHIACNFSCGFTVDGNDGEAGACLKVSK